MLKLREYSKQEMRYILANPTITNPAAPEKEMKPMGHRKFRAYIKDLLSDKEIKAKLNGRFVSISKFTKIRTIPVPLVKVIFRDSEISFQE